MQASLCGQEEEKKRIFSAVKLHFVAYRKESPAENVMKNVMKRAQGIASLSRWVNDIFKGQT